MSLKQIMTVIPILGESNVPVLLRGAPGAGKCEIAVKIHQSGPRHQNPFITLNCIPGEAARLDLELFGTESSPDGRGYPGRLARAQSGTLYLNEVGNLPLDTQSRLLQVLLAKRLPDGLNHPLDVRLMAGSHKDLETEVEMGRLREDFYYYLHRVTLFIPPVRESRDSLRELIYFLLKDMVKKDHRIEVSEEAMTLLCSYSWPGNLRELMTVLQRAVTLSSGSVIRKEHVSIPSPTVSPQDIPDKAGADAASIGHSVASFFCEKTRHLYENGVITLQKRSTVYSEAIAEVEKSMIQSAIRLAAGNKLKAAKLLGITRTTIRKKMVEYGL
jgi:DNA-binding NtrC family response regulator